MSKISKMAQPDLDFVAPEIQLETTKFATSGCDIFSLGLLVCALYNEGRSLIRAGYSTINYVKELEKVGHNPPPTPQPPNPQPPVYD